MNNQSPFYIYISNSPISNVQATGSTEQSSTKLDSGNQPDSSNRVPPSDKHDTKKGTFISKYILTRIAESAVHSAEKFINENTNEVGYMKGDYIKQNEYTNLNSIAQKIVNTGVTAGVAAITGHYVVAAIDIVVASVNTALDVYYDSKRLDAQVKAENFNAEQISKRAGLSSTRDGSRGTEN